MDGGAWWATDHRVAKSRTQLSDFTFFHFQICLGLHLLFGPAVFSTCFYVLFSFLSCLILVSGSGDKESACSAGDIDVIPGSGQSPGEGNGSPVQYSCLDNPRDGGTWWAAVYEVAQSRTQLTQNSSSSSMN